MRPLSCTWFLLIFLVTLTALIQAQDKTQSTTPPPPAPKSTPAAPKRTPPDFIEFFAGEWSGAGEFANGKKIEADVTFTPDLDQQWLVYRHTDRAPGIYKALGTMGIDRPSGQFVMLLNDSGGGVRLFASEGWANGKIVFEKTAMLNKPITSQERFTFERQADNSFKMTYETNRDGQTWKLGDYLVFKKK